MELHRIYLRYYPPGMFKLKQNLILTKNKNQNRIIITGIGLSFIIDEKECIKMIDCLDLNIRYFLSVKIHGSTFSNPFSNIFSTNIEQFARELCANETLLTEEYLPEVRITLDKLQKKLKQPVKNKFYHFKSLKTNILPLTNVAFNKEGNR